MNTTLREQVERETGRVYGELWQHFDETEYRQSVELFEKRWVANGEPRDYFQGKRCLDAGCGGGRYSIALALLGAESVVGVDVSDTGIADATRRAAHIGLDQVRFQKASVLNLPFADGEFDYVMCSGILHHTVGVEQGLSELYRVVKPGGWVYLLLYGAGGLCWAIYEMMRPFAGLLGETEVQRCIEVSGVGAAKRRTMLDSLFCPILETYTAERVDHLLHNAGFRSWRRWSEARMDHESSPAAMIEELEIYRSVWEAGRRSANDEVTAAMIGHLERICQTTIDAAKDAVAQREAGRIDDQQLEQAIIGNGHFRLIAERPE